jgi:hypothetical protein
LAADAAFDVGQTADTHFPLFKERGAPPFSGMARLCVAALLTQINAVAE